MAGWIGPAISAVSSSGGGQQKGGLLGQYTSFGNPGIKQGWLRGLANVFDPAGTIGKLFGLGGEEEQPFNYFDTPEYKRLQSLLYQGTQQGIPGLEQYGQERFQQLVPGIQEQYQAKRRLGAGSTPEIAALGRAGAGVATDVTQMQAQAKQNYASLLAGVTPQPFAAFQQQGPGLLQNLLNFGTPIAQSYLQNKQLGPIYEQLLRGGAAREIAPELDVYGTQQGGATNAPWDYGRRPSG